MGFPKSWALFMTPNRRALMGGRPLKRGPNVQKASSVPPRRRFGHAEAAVALVENLPPQLGGPSKGLYRLYKVD